MTVKPRRISKKFYEAIYTAFGLEEKGINELYKSWGYTPISQINHKLIDMYYKYHYIVTKNYKCKYYPYKRGFDRRNLFDIMSVERRK